MNQLLNKVLLAGVFLSPLVAQAMGGDQWIKDAKTGCEVYGAHPDSSEEVERIVISTAQPEELMISALRSSQFFIAESWLMP